MNILESLICPICRAPFVQEQTMLRCAQRHSFDIASEGYINFLRKKWTGDTREMLQARRAIFEQGHYQPLADIISEQIIKEQTHLVSPTLLDAGCGEGYYTGYVLAALRERQQQGTAIGVDISKEAVRMAARRYREAFFAVATIKEPFPVADHVCDIVLNIFAPRNPSEFARVLKPGGRLLVVIPGPEHLQQLREKLHLLTIEEGKLQHIYEQFAPYCLPISEKLVQYELQLAREEIAQLVQMTPNYWHRSEEQMQKISLLNTMDVTMQFICILFQS